MIRQYTTSAISLVKKEGHVADLLPGFVLDCLDKTESIRVERHIKKCAECRQALAQFQTTFESMLLAVPLKTPNKSLRDKVIDKVKNTNRRRAGDGPVDPSPKNLLREIRALISTPFRLAMILSMAILILVLALNNFLLYRQVDNLKAGLPGSDVHVVRLKGTEDAPQAIGYLMVFSDGKAGTLSVKEAPVLESGFQYQVWLVQQGQGVSGGMFNVNQDGFGSIEISSNLPLDKFDSLDITKEPEGGSASPTGGKILIGDFY